MPKILSLVSDKTTEIRKLALIVLYKTASTFDSQVVTDQILPALDKLRKVGTDPFSNAISLKLYTLFSKNLSIEVIGTKIIPGLVPYLMEPSISNAEFELYKNTINGLMAKIQSDRAKVTIPSLRTLQLPMDPSSLRLTSISRRTRKRKTM